PHNPPHVPQCHERRRRPVTVTLCGDRRGATPMHLVAVGGQDLEAHKDFGAVMRTVRQIGEATPIFVRQVARLGSNGGGARRKNTLPFIPAASVRPGMAMFTEQGGYDVVDRVDAVPLDCPVYDLNVEATHNFVANGIVTHNSIYGFR